MGAGKNVREFALIGFLLLAVLFGMNMMTFIFGNLSSAETYDPVTATIINETGAINNTGYIVSVGSGLGFDGNVVVITATNASNGFLIESANFTVNADNGLIINASAEIWTSVNFTYTYDQKTENELTFESVTNQSLESLDTYADNSSSQFTTLSIAIILILLLSVFAVFWKAFMGTRKGGMGSAGSY